MGIAEDLYWTVDQKFQAAEQTGHVTTVRERGHSDVRYIRCNRRNVFRSIIDPQTAEGRTFIVVGHTASESFRPSFNSLQLVTPTSTIALLTNGEHLRTTPQTMAILRVLVDEAQLLATSPRLAASIVRDVRQYI